MEINVENREEIIALLEQGICPICGRDSFKVPLLHIVQAHGIPQNKLKDTLMISQIRGFSDKELHNKRSIIAKERLAAGILYPKPQKGKKHGKATKEKMAYMAKTKNKSQSGITAAKKVRSKPVCRILESGEVDKIYSSISEAARDNDIRISSIARAVTGEYATAGGYRWKLKN